MTPQDGLLEVIDIIRFDLRPPHYKEACAISKRAKMFLAKDSEKQRKELKSIRATETDEQIDQRVRLTNAVTSVALGPVYSYAEQVWRTDGVTKDINADSVPESTRTRINQHFQNFYHGESLHRYCFNAALHFTKVDPNAWTVFEAEFAQGMQGESMINGFYPVEVMSDEVRGYSFNDMGELQYLAFEFKRTVYQSDAPKNKRDVSDFYLYAPGFSIHLAELDPHYTDGKDWGALGYEPIQVPDTNRMFVGQVFENETTEVPALRWSAYLSDEHGRKVGETLVATAEPILDSLLKDNSLLQLIKFLHAYPEKAQYVRRCNYVDESGRECISGYYGGVKDDENRCKACKGSGKVMVQSEQDLITLAWPDRVEDFVELSKISHYFERPIDILMQYREIVREAQGEIMAAVYNQQNVDPTQLTTAKTATAERIEFDKIYNKLAPFTEIIALGWEKGTRCGFQYYGYTDVTTNMTYPHDMKMKTIIDLLIEREAAKNAAAPYDVIRGIDDDLLSKQYRNNPTKAADIMAFEYWKPWKDKTAEEIAIILQGRDTMDIDRVLWENWASVVNEVKMTLEMPFSKLSKEGQREELYNAVETIKNQITYTTTPDPFGAEVPMIDPVTEELPE